MKKNICKIDVNNINIVNDNKVQCKYNYMDKFKSGINYEIYERNLKYIGLKYKKGDKTIKFKMTIPTFYKYFTKIKDEKKKNVIQISHKNNHLDNHLDDNFFDEEWDDIHETFIYKIFINNVIIGYVESDNRKNALLKVKKSDMINEFVPSTLLTVKKICSSDNITEIDNINRREYINYVKHLRIYKSINNIKNKY